MRPWGRFSTLGLAAVALLVGQFVALAALTWFYGLPLTRLPNLAGDGVAVIVIILVSTPIEVALLMLFAQRCGVPAAEYLGWTTPKRADVVFGIAAVAVFIVLADIVSWLAGHGLVTSFQTDIYTTARSQGWLVLLWLSIIVVTPFGEETLFRGFLFRGWHRTPRDAWIVIIVTAALWAIIHVQYDLYVIGQVFACGLILGWFRWATGSTLLTILMHALVNAEGMLETLLTAHN